MPRISLILPVHNAASTIAEALRSCCDQVVLGDLEIIVIDDASNDRTSEIVAKMVGVDSRIKVVTLATHVGVARAFQRGYEESHGALIARMDADDINRPQRFLKQAALLDSRPELSAVSCLVEIRKRDAVTGKAVLPPDGGYARFEAWLNALIEPQDIASQRFIDQPIVNPTMMIRRSVFEACGGYRELDWAEDYDLWLRLLHEGHQLAKVPEVLFTWSDHPDRLTRNKAVYSQDQFLRCKAYYLSLLECVKASGVAIAGAGPIGKVLAMYLQECGVTVRQFYEVHPRRVGEVIGEVPVCSIESWLPISKGVQPFVVLGAVGQPGKRALIRAQAMERGHVEGESFFAVA